METAEVLPEIKKLMTIKDACAITGMSDYFLYQRIRRNKGPKVIRFGRYFRIHPDDFRRWLDNPDHTQPRTGPGAPRRKK